MFIFLENLLLFCESSELDVNFWYFRNILGFEIIVFVIELLRDIGLIYRDKL